MFGKICSENVLFLLIFSVQSFFFFISEPVWIQMNQYDHFTLLKAERKKGKKNRKSCPWSFDYSRTKIKQRPLARDAVKVGQFGGEFQSSEKWNLLFCHPNLATFRYLQEKNTSSCCSRLTLSYSRADLNFIFSLPTFISPKSIFLVNTRSVDDVKPLRLPYKE